MSPDDSVDSTRSLEKPARRGVERFRQACARVAASTCAEGSGRGRLCPMSEEGESVRSEPEPTSPATRRRRILIVDDHEDAREGLHLLLTYAGHEVETSEDASGALDKLRTFQPEIALIDIGLPGVDGYALARMARQTPEARATCLVALTGYGRAEDRQKALAAGFDAHMTKPVDPDRLYAFLNER
jgi:CheY-like chemotaxis protein